MTLNTPKYKDVSYNKLDKVGTIKDLGVLLNTKKKFYHHVNMIIGKATQIQGFC